MMMNSDIAKRAIFCAKQNTMNLYRTTKLPNEDEVGEKVIIPDVHFLK